MAIKASLSGSVDIEGKFKNDQEVILIIQGTVKAEPHRVSTASGGATTKMTLRLVEAIMPSNDAERNNLTERIAEVTAARNDDGNVPLPKTTK